MKTFSKLLSREKRDTQDAMYFLLKEAVDKGVDGYEEATIIKHKIQGIYESDMEGVKVRMRKRTGIFISSGKREKEW